jgi:hypothetical protein
MDQTIWATIVAALDRALSAVPAFGRRPVYSDRLIVMLLLWAVWHDRCLSWVCMRGHFNSLFRPRQLPSISRFSRRVKGERVQAVLQHMHNNLAVAGTVCPFGLLSYIDGKPMLVSPVSKDPDAKRGKISGGFAKGYKLHAYVNEHRRVLVWSLMPLNTDEKLVATELIQHLPLGLNDTPTSLAWSAPLTLGDSNFDSANLHRAFAQRQRHLLAPLRGEKFVGPKGRAPGTLADMGPRRREVVELWQNHPALARHVLQNRNNIEGTFSVMSLACGMDRLPGFVRRLERVRRWMGCKVILYHSRLLAQQAQSVRAA